jgi:hypothetical protein
MTFGSTPIAADVRRQLDAGQRKVAEVCGDGSPRMTPVTA